MQPAKLAGTGPSPPPLPQSDPATFPSRAVVGADLSAIEAMHDSVFGPGALTRTAYRVREGQPGFTPYCRVVLHDGAVIAAIRFTAIRAGAERGALLLGPLVVAAAFANQGHGRRLIAEGLAAAKAAGIVLVLLVGDPPYYARYGFRPVAPGRIQMPGPVDLARLLMAELAPGAAAKFEGRIAGASDPGLLDGPAQE